MSEVHIFDNISKEELDRMIICFKAQIKSFPPQTRISLSEFNDSKIGVILSGEADLIKYDYDGYRNIIEHLMNRIYLVISSYSHSMTMIWKLFLQPPARSYILIIPI